MRHARKSLIRLVVTDLSHYLAQFPVIVLLLTLLSALGVVWVTHSTRLLCVSRETLLQEQHALEAEWHHLILEEKVLGDAERVEQLAKKQLRMQFPIPEQQIKMHGAT